jgi:putative exosortase-associated protein (TIGR04073 family)
VAEVSGETNPAIGFTLGAVEGTITGLVRGVTGIFDTLTCIFPPYDEPVMQPEYAMEGADAKMQEYFW